MVKYIKLLLDYISYFLAKINSYFFIKKLEFKKIDRDTNFFLFHEGGHGILCQVIQCLKILNKNKKWKIIVAYNPARHNRELYRIVPNIEFIQVGFYFSRYSENVDFKIKLMKKLKEEIYKMNFKNVYFCDVFLKKEFKTPINENFTNETPGYFGSFKNIFDLIKNEKNLILSKKINLNLGQDKNKIKIAIKIRNKGEKMKEIGGYKRDSSNLNVYKNIIEKMAKENFEIFIGGDFQFNDSSAWLKDNKNIFFKKKKLNHDLYNLYLDTDCDIVIGPMSGATNFNVFNKKNQLIIDSYPIGFTWLNSTISFKIVENGFNSINEMISNVNWPIKNNLKTRNLNSDELESVIYDFVINFNRSKIYGTDPKELGINDSHFNSSNAKLSPIWIDIQNRYFKQTNH